MLCRRVAVTMIYVTHEQEEALSLADRLAVLDRPPSEVVLDLDQAHLFDATSGLALAHSRGRVPAG